MDEKESKRRRKERRAKKKKEDAVPKFADADVGASFGQWGDLRATSDLRGVVDEPIRMVRSRSGSRKLKRKATETAVGEMRKGRSRPTSPRTMGASDPILLKTRSRGRVISLDVSDESVMAKEICASPLRSPPTSPRVEEEEGISSGCESPIRHQEEVCGGLRPSRSTELTLRASDEIGEEQVSTAPGAAAGLGLPDFVLRSLNKKDVTRRHMLGRSTSMSDFRLAAKAEPACEELEVPEGRPKRRKSRSKSRGRSRSNSKKGKDELLVSEAEEETHKKGSLKNWKSVFGRSQLKKSMKKKKTKKKPLRNYRELADINSIDSLNILLDGDCRLPAFIDFLKATYSLENYDFYKEAEAFKEEADPSVRATLAANIMQQFIGDAAPRELNLDKTDVRALEAQYVATSGNPPAEMFDKVQGVIHSLLYYDVYMRFITSQPFQDFEASL